MKPHLPGGIKLIGYYTNSENTCRITGFYEMWCNTAQTKSLCYKWEIYNQKWYNKPRTDKYKTVGWVERNCGKDGVNIQTYLKEYTTTFQKGGAVKPNNQPPPTAYMLGFASTLPIGINLAVLQLR